MAMDSRLFKTASTSELASNRVSRLANPHRDLADYCQQIALLALAGGLALIPLMVVMMESNLITLLMVVAFLLVCVGVVTILLGQGYAQSAQEIDARLDEFRAGEFFAHWTYAPGEWADFFRAESHRTSQLAFMTVIGFGIVGVLNALFLALSEELTLTEIVGAGVITLLFGIVSALGLRLTLQRRFSRAFHTPDETYLGLTGLYFNGEYSNWSDVGGPLDVQIAQIDLHSQTTEAAQGEADLSTILLLFLEDSERSSTLRILVPAGREEEAESYVNHLTTHWNRST